MFSKVEADVTHTSCSKGPRLCLSVVVKRGVRMKTSRKTKMKKGEKGRLNGVKLQSLKPDSGKI